MSLLTSAKRLSSELTAWRRHLHQFPELSFQEHETQAYLIAQLETMGLKPRPIAGTGVVVDLGQGTRGVAIRADIDALPLTEESDRPYRSQSSGVMHACGHDGHTAILLGVAQLLSQESALPGRIRLMFQPAEEKLPGGAQPLIAGGVLDGMDRVLGLHLASDMDTGQVGVRAGAVTANADAFTIQIEGRGGHGSQPENAVDPIVAAADLVTSIQTIISRNVSPRHAAVVTVGTIHGGSNFNIIAPRVDMTGTVRTFRAEDRERVQQRLEVLVHYIAEAHQCRGTIQYVSGYPSVVNTARETEAAQRVVQRILGAGAVQHPAPLMAGEDFAYYLEGLPGSFLTLGCRNPAVGAIYPHHHPQFTLDEAALPIGVAVLAETALAYLMLEAEPLGMEGRR